MRQRVRTAGLAILALAGGLAAAPTSDAAFPGQNGRIAFARNFRSIFSVTPSGTRMRRLTDSNFNSSPAFSADGLQIVYSHPTGLGVMNADASGKRTIGQDIEPLMPSWAPDGRTIAFGQLTDVDELWTIPADGGEPSLVAGGSAPTWSPDGSRIVFAANRGICDALYSIAPDGTRARLLVRPRSRGDRSCDLQARYPDFSPRGRFIAYTRVVRRRVGGRTRFLNDIAVRNLRTGRRRLLTRSGRASQPAWSPDGRRVAYVQPDGLWTIGFDGRGARRIVKSARGAISGPSWQPLR